MSMEDLNSPDNSSKIQEYLHSFSASTYLAELDIQLDKFNSILDNGEKLFFFNTVLKPLVTSAMFEYEHSKVELDELYWRSTFICHPGEAIIISQEMEKVKINLKDLEKVFLKIRQIQATL